MLIIKYNALLIFKSCHLLPTQLACPENMAVLSTCLCILSHCNSNKQNVANSDGIIITLHSQKAPQKNYY